MTLGAGGIRPPSLADIFDELDRRTSVVEFGDPHALREQLGNLEEQVKDWVNYLLGTVMNDLYSNDVGAFNWCQAVGAAVVDAHARLSNYAGDVAMWAVHQHEWAFHAGPAAGPPPALPAGPAIPPMWTITYPDIPATQRSASIEAAHAAIVAATQAAVAAHEADHPPPEETTDG